MQAWAVGEGLGGLRVDIGHQRHIVEELADALVLAELRGQGREVFDALLGVLVGAVEVAVVPSVLEEGDGLAAVELQVLLLIACEEGVEEFPVGAGLLGHQREKGLAVGRLGGIEALAEFGPELLGGLGSNARQQTHHAGEGEEVGRARAEAEEGDGVLDVGAIVEALAGGEDVVDL